MTNNKLSIGELSGWIQRTAEGMMLPFNMPLNMPVLLTADPKGYRARMACWYGGLWAQKRTNPVIVTGARGLNGTKDEVTATVNALIADRWFPLRRSQIIYGKHVESTTGNANENIRIVTEELGLSRGDLFALCSNHWHVPRLWMIHSAKGMTNTFMLGRDAGLEEIKTGKNKRPAIPARMVRKSRLDKEAVKLMADLEALGKHRATVPIG